MGPWSLPCFEATRLMSESMDRALPLHQRLALAWHARLCVCCSRYQGQLRFIRGMFRRLASRDAAQELAAEAWLPAAARDRIKQLLTLNACNRSTS